MGSRLSRLLIEAMAKHLPPSASNLRLLDVNGEAAAVLAAQRDDLDIVSVSGDVRQWADDLSADAVVAYGYVLNAPFLEKALAVLRPGGRLIVVDPHGEVRAAYGETLEDAGYVRILVETAAECPLPTGVLMRGEKAHTTSDTLVRIQQTAGADSDMLDLDNYRGRYVHLLIRQTPNVPVWARDAETPLEWSAVTVERDGEQILLAFSSLPKAVAFMQPAVLAGKIYDVNKVGKFSQAAAAEWTLPVLLNATVDILDGAAVTLIEIDPTTAEAPDE
jgi:SAM-dependent methyltransferase